MPAAQTLLEDLNSLPGVLGSMLCDPQRGVLSRAFPQDYDDATLAAVASAVASSAPQLEPLTGRLGVVDLRYPGARVLVRSAGQASLLVLCDKSASAQEVLALATVTARKLERLQLPEASEPTAAVPVPVAGPTQAVAASPAPARPAPDPSPAPAAAIPTEATAPAAPRRRLPSAAVAGLGLVVGAAVAFAAYHFLAAPAARPPPQPAAAVEPRPAARPGAAPSGPVQVRLRLSGADPLATDVAQALAQAFLSAQRASEVAVEGGPDRLTVKGTLEGSTVGVEIAGGSTAQGLAGLLAGTADVALGTRRVTPEEKEKLAVLGSMTSAANEHVLGLFGIAVIVNRANSVAALNREALAQILGGAASDWSQFGLGTEEEWSAVGVNGKGGPVASGMHVYLPDDRSGVAEVVRAAVLGPKPWAPDAKRLGSFAAVSDAVAADAGGIGIVPLPAVAGARAVPVADLDETPLVPTAFTVASEDYLLTQRLYLYTAQATPNPQAARFVDFALSAEGQAVVRKAGLVELGVKAEARTLPASAPPEYARLTASARRLSSTFRFELGASSFDTRAQRDLDRVVEFLRQNELGGGAVRLLGFADGLGGRAANQQLSLDRAAQVAQAFAQRGITGVTVAGLGSSVPVADNAREEGRRRNRRVEVWVAR